MDGRTERGARTRAAIAARAAAIASVDGLDGMTLGRLAGDLGVSKSSVQAAYPTKEAVQLAAVRAATAVFVSEVIIRAQPADEGLPRLLALVDAWLAYVEGRVFPGGCFMGATLSEYDSRTGPVHDALAEAHQAWLSLLEQQAALAQAAGALPGRPSAAMVAVEVDALLAAANVARNFSQDSAPLGEIRDLIRFRLGAPSPSNRGRRRKGPLPSAR